jgi:hypothetical protein
LSVLLGLLRAAGADTPAQLFQAATASYAAADLARAEEQFLACRDTLGDNPVVDYNLALVYLKLESPGRARVYLERTLRLAPRNRGAREQLRLLLARLQEPAPPSPSWLHALWNGLAGSLTHSGALGLAAVLNVLASAAVGLWLATGRRAWRLPAAAFGLAALASWLIAGAALHEELGPARAIIVARDASVRGGPGDAFGEIVKLTEGQAVTLLERPRLRVGPGLSLSALRDERGLWCEVRTASGARGHVRRSLLERL